MLFFLLCLTSFFSPSALNDLAGPSAGPLAQKPYSYSFAGWYNNKIWILFAMSAYSFDEPKFTSAQENRKEKENNKQEHQKFAMHNLPEQ